MKTSNALLDRDHASLTAPAERRIERAGKLWSTPRSTLSILAPINFAADPNLRIAHAKDVASTLGARLTLFNVADTGGGQISWPADARDEATSCQLAHLRGPETVAETIALFAEFINADLILMTSPPRRRWLPFWRSSVTDDVAALTGRPVLVTSSNNPGTPFSCRRILCALALDGHDRATLLQAESLAHRSGGELILLGAVPEVSEGLLHDVLSNVPLSVHQAHQRIDSIGRVLAVPYTAVVMTGSPETCIRQAARQHAADVVVANRQVLRPATSVSRLRCSFVSVRGKEAAVRTIGAVVSESLLTRPAL